MNLIKEKKIFREYLILIIPPQDIKEKIKRVKQLFGEKYNLTHQVEQPANIPVMNLQMNKNNEEKLIEILKNFCSSQETFTIGLSGFAGFRPHTIYIKIADEKLITSLHKRLKQAIIPKLYLETWQIGTYANPHMTVARNLSEEIYNKAIGEYRSRKPELNFKADNLTLLWREKKFGTKINKWQGKEVFKFGQAQDNLFG